MRFPFLLLATCLFLLGCGGQAPTEVASAEPPAYLFFYFEGNAGQEGGLHLAASQDLHHWDMLADSLLRPRVGEWKIFRDPSVIQDDSGTFHLAWTTGTSGFGDARSQNGHLCQCLGARVFSAGRYYLRHLVLDPEAGLREA